MRIGDDKLDPGEAPGAPDRAGSSSRTARPRRGRCAGRRSPSSIRVDDHREYRRHRDDAAAFADLQLGRTEPEVWPPVTGKRALAEGVHPLIDVVAQLRHRAEPVSSAACDSHCATSDGYHHVASRTDQAVTSAFMISCSTLSAIVRRKSGSPLPAASWARVVYRRLSGLLSVRLTSGNSIFFGPGAYLTPRENGASNLHGRFHSPRNHTTCADATPFTVDNAQALRSVVL